MEIYPPDAKPRISTVTAFGRENEKKYIIFKARKLLLKTIPKQGLTGPFYISHFHVLNSIVDTLIKTNLVIFMMQKGLPDEFINHK